jgi:DNA-binding transcriptional LysR family regulator
MRNLNLDQLQTFATVVEQASFSGAARVLNLTQPAVSMQMKELEQRFGVLLVERTGRRVLATAAGRNLLQHVRAIERETEHALRTTALIYHMPPVLQKLRLEQPNVELSVVTGTTMTIVEDLHRNAIDIGLVTLPVPAGDHSVTDVLTESLVAIVPESHEDLPARLTPEDFSALGPMLELPRAQVRRLIDAWMSAAGVAVRPAMELDNLEAIKTIVAAGLGASIVPAVAVSGLHGGARLRVCELDPPLSRTLALVERPDAPVDAARAQVRAALLALGTMDSGR